MRPRPVWLFSSGPVGDPSRSFRGLEGDFRDWEKIDAWTATIAESLSSAVRQTS